MVNKLCLIIGILYSLSYGLTIDTVITADGSPGPYVLSHWFIDTATLVVSSVNDTLEAGIHMHVLPPYAFSAPLNALLFAAPVDSSRRFRVRAQTEFNRPGQDLRAFPAGIP